MAIETYQTAALIRTIEAMASEGPVSFFRDKYFSADTLFSVDEKIYFDVVDSAKRLAPYVSPLVQGKIMEHRGFSTRVFTPPYLKPKGVIDPNQHMHHRLPGEALTGSLTPAARRDRKVSMLLEEHEEAITHREELQASEALRLGQVTVAGEGYPTTVLSFGRDAALTIVLAGALTWDNAGVDPIADVEAWADLVHTNSGASPMDVHFGTDAWAQLVARLTDNQKEILFNSRRGSESRAELGPARPDYVKFRGSWGEFDFWTVSQQFQDEDGNDVELLPPKEVMMAAPAIEGTRNYAAIRDPRADYAPVRAFPKTWTSEDPAQENLMTQSAPLMVPLRPNASLGATVLP